MGGFRRRRAAKRMQIQPWKSAFLHLTLVVAAGSMSACGGSSGSSAPTPPSVLSPAAQLGEKIFEDTALSVSGQQSCATCHVGAYAFAADPSATGPDHGAP